MLPVARPILLAIGSIFILPSWAAAQAMPARGNEIWERFIEPDLFIPGMALLIPILVIVFWGLKGLVRAMRGEPEDFEAWKEEVEELKARVAELERSRAALETTSRS